MRSPNSVGKEILNQKLHFFPFAIFLFHLLKDPSSLGSALLSDGIVDVTKSLDKHLLYFLNFKMKK